jgi:hypothetical protein
LTKFTGAPDFLLCTRGSSRHVVRA